MNWPRQRGVRFALTNTFVVGGTARRAEKENQDQRSQRWASQHANDDIKFWPVQRRPEGVEGTAGVQPAVLGASVRAEVEVKISGLITPSPVGYFPGVTDFRYATTALASASFMRNGIMGKRNCLPLVQIPVVSSLIISASLAGGLPPILGAIMGQLLALPSAGDHGTGAPCNQLLESSSPLLSRGVWHCPHIATPSTRYLPRAASPPLAEAPLATGALPACAYAPGVQMSADKSPNVASARGKFFIRFIRSSFGVDKCCVKWFSDHLHNFTES